MDLVTQGPADIISRFGDVRVVVVGDAMVDEYVAGDCTRISPEAPVPVLHVRSIRTVPGGAANTAANISALGGQPVLVTAIGEDIAGATLRQLLEDRSVPCVLLADDRPTVRKVRALGGQQQLLRLDFEGDGVASAELRTALVEALGVCVSDAAAIVVSDYAKGLLDAGTVEAIRSLARKSGVPLVIDPRPEHGAWYRGCDYLTPNWKEALSLAGIVEPWSPDNDRIDSVGRQLVERFDANVLLTLGPRGIAYFGRDGHDRIHEDAQAREVFDVSGAGDTVVATFALALGAGADVAMAIRLANKAAGAVVGRVGTAVATAADLSAAAHEVPGA